MFFAHNVHTFKRSAEDAKKTTFIHTRERFVLRAHDPIRLNRKNHI